MSQPYIGEIRMFGGNFAPLGWAFCDGQSLEISQNNVLFSVLGATYGGDGQTTFNLPDLRGRIPLHMGTNPSTGTTYTLGQKGGSEQVTLTLQQIPAHSHVPVAQGSPDGTANSPSGTVWAGVTAHDFYGAPATASTMNPAAIGTAGGSQPHDNMMPFLAVSFILSLYGIYPSQT